MRCHYEVLGIGLEATLDEIKKSYRKCALQWHPDKHPNNQEEANGKFLEIQDAYETLSNDQERAWYDAHREVLINGGVPGEENEKNYVFNIYPFFSPSCFKGFGDDAKSFYTIYREMFLRIGDEDRPYFDEEVNIPDFGRSDSDYETVVAPFYAFWMSYCTPRSFVWCEKHDTREAGERYVRRAMEKENKKFRDKAKKERNEEIRKVVELVRKKDKRVEQYRKIQEEKSLQAQKKAKERKEADRLRRVEQIKNYVEPEWSAIDQRLEELDLTEKRNKKTKSKKSDDQKEPTDDGDDLGGDVNAENESANESGSNDNDNDDDDNDDYDEYDDTLFCIACNKSFRSEKSFMNHEKSKKHQENVQILKKHMHEENRNLFFDVSPEAAANDDSQLENSEEETSKKTPVAANNCKQRISKKQKKNRKQKRLLQNQNETSDSGDEAEPLSGEQTTACPPASSDALKSSETSLTEPKEEAALKLANERASRGEEANDNDTKSGDISTQMSQSVIDQTDHAGKNEESPVNDSAVIAQVTDSNITDSNKGKQLPSKPIVCSVCAEEFSTRNKLFDHISKLNHAAPKVVSSCQPEQPLSHNALKKLKRQSKVAKK